LVAYTKRRPDYNLFAAVATYGLHCNVAYMAVWVYLLPCCRLTEKMVSSSL